MLHGIRFYLCLNLKFFVVSSIDIVLSVFRTEGRKVVQFDVVSFSGMEDKLSGRSAARVGLTVLNRKNRAEGPGASKTEESVHGI